MGRREKLYSNFKKVLNPESKPMIKANSKKASNEPGSKLFGNQIHPSQEVVHSAETVSVCHVPKPEEVGAKNDQNHSAQLPKSAAALTPKITSGIMRHIPVIAVSQYVRKLSKEDMAATQIQTAYRGYLARRTLRALRGLGRLKFLVQGQSVKRQAANTLQCMQALARVQSQACSRRAQISRENQALQKQLLLKNSKKHTPFRNSDDWKDCAQSKQIEEEKMRKKHEAALRRERSRAYSSVHQQTWKSPHKRPSNMTVMGSDNPNWGWSWLERWMAERPWEGQNSTDERLDSRPENVEVEATKELRTIHKPPSSNKIAPKRPPIPTPKPGSTRMRLSNASRSTSSDKNRRHSFAGSRVSDYESSVASTTPRSHTMHSKPVNTRPSLQSPSGTKHNRTPKKSNSVRLAEKSPSPPVPNSNPRRHSDLPKVKKSSYTQQNKNITAEIS